MIGIEMGEGAAVVAANAAIAWGGARICYAWLPWVVTGWSALRRQTLGLLPLSIVWLVAWLAIEGAYYGVARVALWIGGPNLWGAEYAHIVWIVRGAVLAGMVAHIIPKWLADGHPIERVRRMALRFVGELVAIWSVVAALLW